MTMTLRHRPARMGTDSYHADRDYAGCRISRVEYSETDSGYRDVEWRASCGGYGCLSLHQSIAPGTPNPDAAADRLAERLAEAGAAALAVMQRAPTGICTHCGATVRPTTGQEGYDCPECGQIQDAWGGVMRRGHTHPDRHPATADAIRSLAADGLRPTRDGEPGHVVRLPGGRSVHATKIDPTDDARR